MLGELEEGGWRAHFVVERGARGNRFADWGKDGTQHVLGRGFAVRTGNANNPKLAERLDPADDLGCQCAEGDNDVGHHDIVHAGFGGLLAHHEHGAARDGIGNEQKAVGHLTGFGEENSARRHLSRVG